MKYLGVSGASTGWRSPKEGIGLPTREKLRLRVMGIIESSTQAYRAAMGESRRLRTAPSQPLAVSRPHIREMGRQ